jgi:hypothetical protein
MAVPTHAHPECRLNEARDPPAPKPEERERFLVATDELITVPRQRDLVGPQVVSLLARDLASLVPDATAGTLRRSETYVCERCVEQPMNGFVGARASERKDFCATRAFRRSSPGRA